MSEAVTVNRHYLDRLVAVSDSHGVEATEDIVCGQGIKLVAKGGNIDGRVRDRLLQHKLLKPLESSVRVVGGAATRPIDSIAHALLHRHALLSGICGAEVAQRVEQGFLDLRLSAPLESLLSLYAAQGAQHLEHAVGVSLLAGALLCQHEGAEVKLANMLLAGLMHDVGELYIDPQILNGQNGLTPAEWKHVVTHPLVGASILRELPGGGAHVAELVLHHHERLDGFGYPLGLREGRIPQGGQILALAEMLMGVIESGRSPGEHAAVAVKLIPGEFQRRLVDRIIRGARVAAPSDAAESSLAPPSHQSLAERALQHSQKLQRLSSACLGLGSGSAAMRELIEMVSDRLRRLTQALSSTGLQVDAGGAFCDSLRDMDPHTALETSMVLQELGWRLNELQRELIRRTDALSVDAGERLRCSLEIGQTAGAC